MRKKLRLYVWEGVLADYTDGIAFALAHSPEEAVEEIKKQTSYVSDHFDGIRLDGVEPKVYEAPVGFAVYGGG